MTDAELIYNACLRGEARLEAAAKEAPGGSPEKATYTATFLAMCVLREEIGRGMVEAYPR